MYEHVFQFFGLRENPFHVSPDPRFFFSTATHNSALTDLMMGVDSRQGFIVLIGDAGTGKTILLQRFLGWLQARRQSSCYIFQSQLNTAELLYAILTNFGVLCESRRVSDTLAAFSEWLLRRHAAGDSPVVIIDEAQAMSMRTLDRLRMLLNLEKPGTKLLQLVLAGQPELDEKLRRPELRQLHQRIVFRCHLSPLSLEETREYVKSRLTRSGAQLASIFPDEGLQAIYVYSEGIPRVINLVCEHALLTAYAENQNMITPEIVSRAATDIELQPQPMRQSQPFGLRHFLPQFGSTRPTEFSGRVSPKSAALSSYMESTIGAPAKIPQLKQDVRVNSPDAVMIPEVSNQPHTTPENNLDVRQESTSTEPLPFAAAAVVGGVTAPTVNLGSLPIPDVGSVLSVSPSPEPKRELRWRAEANPLLRARDPNFVERIIQYSREVSRSFVKDWRDFVRSFASSGKTPRSSSHKG